MKLLLAYGLLAIAFVSSAHAAPSTCMDRANICLQKGGGAACTETLRMAECRKSAIYVAPSGKSWPAPGK